MKFYRILRLSPRPELSWAAFPVLTALYFVIALNDPLWTLWRTVTSAPHTAQLATLVFAVAITAILTGFMLLISHPWFLKLGLSIIIFLAASNSYFARYFGTIVDTSMIRNIMETDWREAWELVTPAFVNHMLVFAGIPIVVLNWLRVRRISSLRWCLFMPASVLMALLIAIVSLGAQFKFFQLVFREHRELRLQIIPSYSLYSLAKYFIDDSIGSDNVKLQPVALDARASHHNPRRKVRSRPLLAVMVVGETARADHFSVNGYERLTNPQLAQENILSFRNAWSCGTSTAESLPCMFSDLGRENYSIDRADKRQSLLDVLSRIKVNALWIDNNSGSKGVAKRIRQLGRKEFTPKEIHAYCNEEECFDEVLLSGVQRSLSQVTGDALIVLHQMGEHGPAYYKRHPPEFMKFTPECQIDDAYNCETESLVNAYDNDILYTDHVLAGVIALLKAEEKNRDVLMLYMSDHGESLGENGVYLHGHPWMLAPEAQKHVPMMLWMSDLTYRDMKINKNCLQAQLDHKFDHDNLFHTFLGLFTDRKSKSYIKQLDMLSACRG